MVSEAVQNGQPLGKATVRRALLSADRRPDGESRRRNRQDRQGIGQSSGLLREEVDAVIDSLASIIEPAMIILLGAIVGLSPRR